jgi:CBS domain-containing protein
VLSTDELNSLDPVAYVRRVAPFHSLPDALFESAARSLEIGLFPAGTRLVTARGEPLQHLYVIRSGGVRLELHGKVLQELEEGEIFGYTSLVTRRALVDVVVSHDLLAYRIPAPHFEALLADGRFAAHFAVGLTDRLRASLESAAVVPFPPDLAVPVEQLVRRPAEWVDRGVDVRAVAYRMRERGVSSVLVRGEPESIVTDRDLRNRVLGRDLGPATPVTDVCSFPLKTVAAETPVYEAWRVLLDARVNHLPVRRGNDIIGVVTSTDLLKHSAQGPIAMLRRIERLASRDSVPGYREKVVEMTSTLLAAGLDAAVIGGLVTRLNDALLRRILAWAGAELGSAPGAYAWLALGREGRREQVLLTARDDALVYDEAAADGRSWFQCLVERADADLERAGFPPRHVTTAAASPLALAEFARLVERARERPFEVAPLFDMRRAAGHLELGPVEAVFERARSDAHLLSALARGAVEAGAGVVLPRRGTARIDVSAAISAVVDLARCFAIERGDKSRNTLERLEDALRAGIISDRSHATITEAYRLLVGIEVRAQLRAAAAGAPPVKSVAANDLSPLERTRVKDAMRAVRRWCEAAAQRYAQGD